MRLLKARHRAFNSQPDNVEITLTELTDPAQYRKQGAALLDDIRVCKTFPEACNNAGLQLPSKDWKGCSGGEPNAPIQWTKHAVSKALPWPDPSLNLESRTTASGKSPAVTTYEQHSNQQLLRCRRATHQLAPRSQRPTSQPIHQQPTSGTKDYQSKRLHQAIICQ